MGKPSGTHPEIRWFDVNLRRLQNIERVNSQVLVSPPPYGGLLGQLG